MIVLNSVSKDVGQGTRKRRVLSSIDCAIPPRTQVVVLGHSGSGKSLLLSLMAGMATPTEGWIERRAVVSLPGGVLRFARRETPRKFILRMSEVYRVDPERVMYFVARFQPIHDIMNVEMSQLRGPIRLQLNMALSYALPCDYYLLDGGVALGRDPTFRQFCNEAFAIRRAQAATIVTTNSVKIARTLNYEATGALLFRGKLHFCKTLPEAIANFERLPVDIPPPRDLDPGPPVEEEAEVML